MKTTLNQIRAKSPCADGWTKLLKHLNKTAADDEPLALRTILESNGFDDALWCLRAVEGLDREKRLLAIAFAREVQHLMTDPRSLVALDVAEKFANGEATQEELALAAADAAWAAAYADAAYAVRAAARAARAAAAARAARAAAWAAEGAAAAGGAYDAATWSDRAANYTNTRQTEILKAYL
jgi:hypothetical protein